MMAGKNFKNAAKTIVKNGGEANRPEDFTGMTDLVDPTDSNMPKHTGPNTYIHTGAPPHKPTKPPSPKKVRENFNFPAELSEKLRSYAFLRRTNKVEIVVQALEEYFERH